MIFKIKREDFSIEWCTAKDILHLLKSYDKEFDLCIQDIMSIEEISAEQAKEISVTNLDYVEGEENDMPETIPLSTLVSGDEFCIIASTEFS